MSLCIASGKAAAEQTLVFRVGPWKYTLRIPAGPIIFGGVERMGLCLEPQREIWISFKARERLGVLIHELTHAWVYHTGEPRTVEDWCDLNGTILAAAMLDLAEQGGVAALNAVKPCAITLQSYSDRLDTYA